VSDFRIDSVTSEHVTFAVSWKGMLALEHLVAQSKLWDQVQADGVLLNTGDLHQIITEVRHGQTKYRLAGGQA
jgi:hypothetical protein